MGFRKLSDAELNSLGQECEQRLGALQAAGVQINGLGEHFIMSMLEVLLGPGAYKQAQELHLEWMKGQLDTIEELHREARARHILGIAK